MRFSTLCDSLRGRLALAIALLLTAVPASAQVVTFEPAFPNVEEPVTIYFHADEGTAGLAGYTGEVYAHTGVITDASTSPSDWKYVKTNWGQNTPETRLERIGTDLYRLDIADIRAYYGVPASEQIRKLAFVFRSADASREGKDDGGADFFVDLYEAGLNVRIVEPLATPLTPLLAAADTTLRIVAVASAVGSPLEGITLRVNGSEVAQTANDTLTYELRLEEPGRVDVEAIATDEAANTDTASFYAVRNPEVTDAPVPSGTLDGINYDPSDPAKVTLSLYAPHKSFVYVVGDFNDWEVDADYFMARDFHSEDSVRFWITLDGLEPGREYAFQYLVDGELRIADPYTDKILDPWNDQHIPGGVYPDLLHYPAGRAAGPVSVLQTGRQPYDWAVEDFARPEPHELVIYELHIRDFLADHDYETLADTLGYLQRLGVNAVELMPVNEFEGNSSWGYNPSFYFAPDKYYGPADDLKRFIDAAHERSMAVLIDLVLNHTYGLSPMVQMYLDPATGRPSAENPWYNPTHNFQNTSAHWGYDFDHESPATQAFVDRVTGYWLEEYKVDGFRFDFTKGFSNNYKPLSDEWGSLYDADRVRLLKRMVDAARAVEPGAYMIMEHLAENREDKELADYGILMWGNMNHAYNEATMGYHENGKSNLSGAYYGSRGWSQPNLIAYMESHDEERLMYKNLQYGNSGPGYTIRDLDVALERQKLAGAFFFTIPGPKMIWQFGELGYDYSIDYNGRLGEKPIMWNAYLEDPLRVKLYKTWQALLTLRHENEIFTSPETQVLLSVGPAVKRIKLTHPEMNAVIVGNFGVTEQTAVPAFQAPGTWYDYFSGDAVEVTDVNMPVSLLPGEFHIYTSEYVAPPEEGLITVDAEEEKAPGSASEVALGRSAPNPFRGETTISFTLPRAGQVRLAVYDLLGREVAVLVDGLRPSGRHEARLDGRALTSGTYLYRLEAEGRVLTGKMTLLK